MRTELKKLVLVDDHLVIRDGLSELIPKLGPYEVIKLYGNGMELVNSFPLFPEPDLIMLDISMPEMDGCEVVAMMKEKNINIPILILTVGEDDEKIIRLFRNGVRGYVKKSSSAEVIKEALEQIFKTGYYHNDIMAFALQTPDVPLKKTPQDIILEKLSAREKEFLKLICHEEEYTYDQIASIMHVQHRTVDAYRESIFGKFNIKSKTGLVLFILRNKLMDRIV